MNVEINYLAATHANELSSLFTYMLLTDDPRTHIFFEEVAPKVETAIPGVNSLIAHPAALLAGRGLVRYTGLTQLQDHYEVQNFLDEEDQAANYVLDWLGAAATDPNFIVLDGHNNTTRALNYIRIGSLASRRSIAGANIVTGFTDFVVKDDSFSDMVWTGAILEESATRGLSDHIDIARKHYAALYRLSTESPESLDDHYAAIREDLSFYRNVEITTFDDNGELFEHVRELEKIESDRAFTSVEVSANVREGLKIGDEDLVTGSWGYNNMSPKVGSDGRRLFFGNLFYEIAPPSAAGSVWVEQKEMARLRLMSDPEPIIVNVSFAEEDKSIARLERAAEVLDRTLAEILSEALNA
jgi:hypothetical protein